MSYLHSYLFHKSTHSNGSGQNAFEHGLFDAQYLSMFLAITACPHCVPFVCGGSGKLLPSNLLSVKMKQMFFPFKTRLIKVIVTISPDVVYATVLIIRVHLKGFHASKLRLTANKYPFLLIYRQPLMALERKCFVVIFAFATINLHHHCDGIISKEKRNNNPALHSINLRVVLPAEPYLCILTKCHCPSSTWTDINPICCSSICRAFRL